MKLYIYAIEVCQCGKQRWVLLQLEQFSVPWTSVHSVRLCKRTEVNTFLFSSLIHFSACQCPINFTYRKSAGVLQISKIADDQNVALMLMQVLIQHISDMENEFMAWFHVFFLDDVIKIGHLMHGLINGIF